jgi:hypothetical protein
MPCRNRRDELVEPKPLKPQKQHPCHRSNSRPITVVIEQLLFLNPFAIPSHEVPRLEQVLCPKNTCRILGRLKMLDQVILNGRKPNTFYDLFWIANPLSKLRLHKSSLSYLCLGDHPLIHQIDHSRPQNLGISPTQECDLVRIEFLGHSQRRSRVRFCIQRFHTPMQNKHPHNEQNRVEN